MTPYELLFADQPLDELLVDVELPPGGKLAAGRAKMWEGNPQEAANAVAGGSEPWASFIVAVARQATGQTPTKQLRSIAEDGFQEARARLWAWTALRQLGEKPAQVHAREVLGVVVEVPVDGGLDVLAAYADGSVRFLGQAGQIVVREPGDGPDKAVVDVLSEGYVLLSLPPAPRDKDAEAPPPENVRLTALSAMGLHRIEAPWAEVEAGGPYQKLFQALATLLKQVTQV